MSEQIGLDLGIEIYSEEKIKLMSELSKLTGFPNGKFEKFDEKELSSKLDETKKVIARGNKIKKELLEFNVDYDKTLSLDENEKILNALIDKRDNPTYKFPFRIYFKGGDIQTPTHVFEQDSEYTEKEIVDLMFEHGFKEFAGKVKFQYEQEENMLIPNFASQVHG